MVFRGKPSEACELCRKRKVRCDLSRPYCTRCEVYGVQCPGYRDLRALQFVYEDPATGGSYISSKEDTTTFALPLRAHEHFSDPGTINPPWRLQRHTVEAAPPSPTQYTPTQPPDDLANAFFFKYYISNSWLNGIPWICDLDNADPALVYAFKCTSMISFANKYKSQEHRDQALSAYSKALAYLNKSLVELDTCVESQTMLAIFLLSFFEALRCETRYSMSTWRKHIGGLVALFETLSRRGLLDECPKPDIFMVLLHLQSLLMIFCLQEGAVLSPKLMQWLFVAQEHLPYDQRQLSQVYACGYRIASICHKTSLAETTKDDEACRQLTEVDQRLEAWARETKRSSPDWQYETYQAPDADPFDVFDGYYLVYPALRAPLGWNAYRAMRIYICNCLSIYEMIKPTPSSLDTGTYNKRNSLVSEVLATVPQVLNYNGLAGPSDGILSAGFTAFQAMWFLANTAQTVLQILLERRVSPSLRDAWCRRRGNKPMIYLLRHHGDQPPGFSGLNRILMQMNERWAGGAAANEEVAATGQEVLQLEWICDRLQHIAREAGFRQAWMIADNLQTTLKRINPTQRSTPVPDMDRSLTPPQVDVAG